MNQSTRIMVSRVSGDFDVQLTVHSQPPQSENMKSGTVPVAEKKRTTSWRGSCVPKLVKLQRFCDLLVVLPTGHRISAVLKNAGAQV